MSDDIRSILREYVAQSSLLRRDGPINDSTPLSLFGILDSVAVLELVIFLETRFGIEFAVTDLMRNRLDTIDQIERLVRQKLTEKSASEHDRC